MQYLLLPPTRLRALSRSLLFLSILPVVVGCPQSRAPVEAVDAGNSTNDSEKLAPDHPQTLEMIKEMGARTVADKNGNLTSVDFSDLAVRDDQIRMLAGLPKLKKLRLWGAGITDAVFDELVELDSIVDVGLENTEITDAGLQRLEQMQQLRTVFLRRNTYLTDAAFDVFPKLPHLTAILCLYHNITDEALVKIKDLEDLRVLDVRGCATLSDDGFLQLGKLKKLEQVKMRTAGMTNKGMALFKGTPNLKVLVLEDAPITAPGLENLKGASNMVELELLRSLLDDAALSSLSNMPKLKKLLLRDSQTPITGEGLAFLKNSTELTSLNLAETEVNDEGLRNIESMSKLTLLDLWNTQVTDAGMESVAKLKNLTALTLDGTQVTDAGVAQLEGLPLQKLFLQGCQISDAGIESLKKIKTLQAIDLKFCVQVSEDAVNDLKATLPELKVFGFQ